MEDIKQIEALIEKYYNGETSIDEERKLQWFFQTQSVPDRLKPEAEMFRYYYLRKNDESAGNLNEKLGELIDQQSHKRILFGSTRSFYWISGVAASIVVLVGLWIGFRTNLFDTRQAYEDTFEDPQLAYMETKRILYMVSDKLNQVCFCPRSERLRMRPGPSLKRHDWSAPGRYRHSRPLSRLVAMSLFPS